MMQPPHSSDIASDQTMKIIPKPTLSSGDDKEAMKESEYFDDADYDGISKKNEHERKEKFKKHLGVAAILIFWGAVASLLMMAAFWVYHLISPSAWHFLNQIQLDKIQTILFSATLVKIVGEFSKKYFN